VELETGPVFLGIVGKSGYVVGLMNGTEQQLNLTIRDGHTVLEGMLIKDYALMVRVYT